MKTVHVITCIIEFRRECDYLSLALVLECDNPFNTDIFVMHLSQSCHNPFNPDKFKVQLSRHVIHVLSITSVCIHMVI